MFSEPYYLYTTIFTTALSLSMGFYAITQLTERHSGKINELWYIYSPSVCLSYIVLLVVPARDVGNPPPIMGKDGTLSISNLGAFAVGILTDWDGEISLIKLVAFLVIVPQGLIFILSGILGLCFKFASCAESF
jgi:hypothetical protein